MARALLIALISMLAAFAAFSPALRGEFVGDDRTIQAYQLPAIKNAGDVNRDTLEWSGGRYYRPLASLTFLADEALNNLIHGPATGTQERLAQKRAFIPHASTLLMHAIAAGIAALLAVRLLGGGAGAWAAALIFALHPVHGESVSFITARSDILATIFILSALITALKAEESPFPASVKHRIASGLLFLLALLSKEVAFPGLVLIPLLVWAFCRGNHKEALKKALNGAVPLLGSVAVYAILRLTAGGFTPPQSYGGEPAILKMVNASSFYIIKMIFPWPTEPFVPFVPGFGETALGLTLLMAAGAGSYLAMRRGMKIYAAMWFWFVLAVIPALPAAAWGMAHTPVAERYLYLPSWAYAMALGALAEHMYASNVLKKAVTPLLAVILAIYAASSWNAAEIWRNDITIFQTVLKREKTALNPFPLLNLGHAHMREGSIPEAENAYRKVITESVPRLDRYVAEAYQGLGEAALLRHTKAAGKNMNAEALENLKKAEEYFSEAAAIIPDRVGYWKKLATIRLKLMAVEKMRPAADRTPRLAGDAGQAIQNAMLLDPGDQELPEFEKIRKNLSNEQP